MNIYTTVLTYNFFSTIETMKILLVIDFPIHRLIYSFFFSCVRLRGAIVGIDDEDDSTFTITVDNKTFHFQAKDSEEREKWIRALGKYLH